MNRIVRFAVARAKLTIALWGALIAALAVVGLGVQDRLEEGNFDLPDTESHAAAEIDREAFGPNDIVTVMLEGPPRELEAQGRRLVSELRADWTVLSPWDRSAVARRLRPTPRAASVVVTLPHPVDQSSADALVPLDRALDRIVREPVEARMSGFPVVGRELNDAALESSEEAQWIAFPVLIIVLLFVFRSPLAAAIPLGVGLATVSAGAGLMALLAELYPLTAFGVSISAMMGLALGVDYSLLIVSRFREDVDEGYDVRAAAEHAAQTAGRTVLFAGLALAVAMLLAALLAPGDILISSATGVMVAVVLSMGAGVTVVPAALTLLGRHLDRWQLGPKRPAQSPLLARTARAVMRAPVPIVLVILVAMTAMSIPALSLEANPPNARALPDDGAKEDFDAIERAAGPGYLSSFQVVLSTDRGNLTTPQAARELARFELAAARDPRVAGVVGPAALAGAGRELDFVLNRTRGGNAARILVLPRQFATSPGTGALRDDLSSRGDALERRTGWNVNVGGVSGAFVDYKRGVASYIPTLIFSLAGLTFLLLIPVLRALALPFIAVVLNVFTVGAAFGMIALLFATDPPPLGGPGFVDAVSLAGIFTVLFALSVDYEMFLLARMREGYLATGDTREAILHGLSRTGTVITGAAVIMIAVFLAFATSGFAPIRQLGTGLAIAVLLDAMVLRLLLLPAAMALLGRWSWWLPAGLDRRLPRLDVEGRPAEPAPAPPG